MLPGDPRGSLTRAGSASQRSRSPGWHSSTSQRAASVANLTMDNFGFTYDGVSTPLHRYTPVETTVNAVEPSLDYYWHVHDLAQDCVNQGGISNVRMIQPPDRIEQQ